MPRKPFPLFENVTILDAGSEGKAVTRVNDLVVFVPFAVPGDVVDIQVVAKKKSFYEGRVVKVHSYSEKRIEPVCSHFGTCGGCKWQNMPYEEQLKFKQKQVEDVFTRIGKFPFPPIKPILGSEKSIFYRNKLEFTFSNRRWLDQADMQLPHDQRQVNALGFHIPQLFDRVLNIDYCYLQPEPSNAIRQAVYKLCLDKKWSFYDVRSHTGFLRNLLVRNTVSGDVMVIMVFAEENEDDIREFLTFVENRFPEVTSLMYVINQKHNDVITDQEIRLWKGDPFLMEEMEPAVTGHKKLKFKVGPISFYQTNPIQAWHLYKTAFDFAGFTGNETVYDLYCGTGTITNYIASSVAKVVGIEYVESAIEDARENSALNGISNTVFYAGDLARTLNEEFVKENGRPDIIITDPPRSGMHEKVIGQILSIAPTKVVYVSCNPATQARDIALLGEKYEVAEVQPVDMFPHTHHVENVVLLNLKA